jgi:hypothetical protein
LAFLAFTSPVAYLSPRLLHWWLTLQPAAFGQVTLRRNPAPDPRFQPDAVATSLSATALKDGSVALFLGRAHYGCLATVLPAASQGMTKKGEEIKGGKEVRRNYRVQIAPAALTAGQAAQAAKRMLTNMVRDDVFSFTILLG